MCDKGLNSLAFVRPKIIQKPLKCPVIVNCVMPGRHYNEKWKPQFGPRKRWNMNKVLREQVSILLCLAFHNSSLILY